MTDTWAAKVLEGVPRYAAFNGESELGPHPNGDWVRHSYALAAIARMGAGDGLVERATAALEGVTPGEWGTHHHDNYSEVAAYQPTFNSVCDVHMAADANFIAFTRQWVPEAAAHIAALTAERDRFEAALSRACLVGGTTYLVERAETAEAEAAALRERLARMEGALNAIDAMDPEQQINGFSESALRGTVLHMGGIARAALADGGGNKTCEKCNGTGWVLGHQLDQYPEEDMDSPVSEKTLYICDGKAHSKGATDE